MDGTTEVSVNHELHTGPSEPAARSWRHPSAFVLTAAVVVFLTGAAAALAGWLDDAPGGVPSEDSVDVGFLRDMADHHDQAVQLSFLLLEAQEGGGGDDVLRGFATDTVASQRYEIGLMDARLQDWGHGRGSATRTVMAWMGMPTPIADMAGMASTDELAALSRATGRDADLIFIRLMRHHHEGGIHMAEYAWQHAETEVVRALAERIAKVQLLEIRDLDRVEERLTAAQGSESPGE